ncbi:MAG TPA: hypothetical protein VFJ97_01015 [Dermatophilaceae bacterium]|nr:hypothetical protein [Dermatophilaceae bacterium]
MTSGQPGGRGHRTREHIVIVGGPSNTFNGYGHWHQSETYHAEPRPADTSPANITKYLRGDPAHVIPGDPLLEPTSTHDYYWANFLYAAVKLVELRGRVPEAITPARGDLLTFMVWLPSYYGARVAGQRVDRELVDWQASPYNMALHRGSAYVNANPYNPKFRASDQFTAPPRPQTPPTRKGSSSTPPVYGSTEPDIDHEILMRTTGEVDSAGNAMPDGGFAKRMHDPDAYVDALTDLPIRICYGSKWGQFAPVRDVPPLLGVYVKVLFVRDVDSIFGYLNTGTWTGERRLAMTELVDEDHMLRGDIDDCTWAGQAFAKKGMRTPLWDTAPSVTRAKCKIRRLDYVGHSAPESLFLEYGIQNSKGAEPEASVVVTQTDFVAKLDRLALASNVKVYLWGCFLGGAFAPALGPLVTNPKSIRGAIGRTMFDGILGTETNLPTPAEPVNEGWVLFP